LFAISPEEAKEKAMSTDKKTEAPQHQPKTATPDALIKTAKKGDVELTEEELVRVAGGAAVDYFSKNKA